MRERRTTLEFFSSHVVNGVSVIQSFANGGPGRADSTVDLANRRVQGVRVLAPRSLCTTAASRC